MTPGCKEKLYIPYSTSTCERPKAGGTNCVFPVLGILFPDLGHVCAYEYGRNAVPLVFMHNFIQTGRYSIMCSYSNMPPEVS